MNVLRVVRLLQLEQKENSNKELLSSPLIFAKSSVLFILSNFSFSNALRTFINEVKVKQ